MSSQSEHPSFLLGEEDTKYLRFYPDSRMRKSPRRSILNRPPRRGEIVFEITLPNDGEERMVVWDDEFGVYVWEEWAIAGRTRRGYLGMNSFRFSEGAIAKQLEFAQAKGHYKCPMCEDSRAFSNYTSIARHMAEKHNKNANVHVCKCGFYTQYERTFKEHRCSKKTFVKAYKLRSEAFQFSPEDDKKWRRVLRKRLSGEYEFLEGMLLDGEALELREKIRRGEDLNSKNRKMIKALRMSNYREDVWTQGPKDVINALSDEFKDILKKRGITGIALDIGEKLSLALMAWEACRTWKGLLASVTYFCCVTLKMRESLARKLADVLWKLLWMLRRANSAVNTQGPKEAIISSYEFTMDMLQAFVDAIMTYCGVAISLPTRFLYGLHTGVLTARDAIAVKEIITTHIPELLENMHCWITGAETRASQCERIVRDIYNFYLDLKKPKIGERDLEWASKVYEANGLCDLYEDLLPEINTRSGWFLKMASRDVSYKIKNLREMKLYADSLSMGAESRIEPVGLLFYGPGGLLKSVLIKKMTHQFIAELKGYDTGKPINPKELDFYTWSRPKGSERMDGVEPFHEVFQYDDVATIQDANERGKELCELIPILTCLPYCANVADVESKGNKFIKPKLVILSMNESISKTSKLGLTDNMAFMRRFIVVEAIPRGTLESAKKAARDTHVRDFRDFDEIVQYRVHSCMGEEKEQDVTAEQLYNLVVAEHEKRKKVFESESTYIVEPRDRGNVLGGVVDTQGKSIQKLFTDCGWNYPVCMRILRQRFGDYASIFENIYAEIAKSRAVVRNKHLFYCGVPIPMPAELIVALGEPPYKAYSEYRVLGEHSRKDRLHLAMRYAGKVIILNIYHDVKTGVTVNSRINVLGQDARFDYPARLGIDFDSMLFEKSKQSPTPSLRVPPLSSSDPKIVETHSVEEDDEPDVIPPFEEEPRFDLFPDSVTNAMMNVTLLKNIGMIIVMFFTAIFGGWLPTIIVFFGGGLVTYGSTMLDWLIVTLFSRAFGIFNKQDRAALQYVLGIFSAVVATYGTYWVVMKLFAKDEEETQTFRDKEQIHAPRANDGTSAVSFQGPDMVTDVMLDQQMDAVFERNQFMAITEDGTKIHLLGFARDLFLTTTHEWATVASAEKLIIIRAAFREEVHMKNITKKTIIPKDGLVPEAVVLKIQGMQVKDIVSKFRRASDYSSNYYQCYVSRISRRGNTFIQTRIPIDSVTFDSENELQMNDVHKGVVVTRGFLVGSGVTVDGDCTCPWFVVSPQCPRKVAGIHIAGNTTRKYAYCSVIFQEWLIGALNYFGYTQRDDHFLTEKPVTQGFPNTLPLGEVKAKFAGSVLPPKTKLRKSGLYFNGKASPCLDLLWQQRDNGKSELKRDYYESEMVRYCGKFARIPKCPTDFEAVIMMISSELSTIATKMRSPMATLAEVLNGDPTYGTSEINLKGAKGFPDDRLFPGRGKSPIIYKDREDMQIKCTPSYQPILEQSVQNIFSENGGTMNFARVSFKDELGVKQRLFFAGNLPHYVAGDMVLGRFFAMCRYLRWFGPGTALNTREGHFVVQYLLSNDCDRERVIMLDISGMDLSESYESLQAVHKLIIHSISLVHDDEDWERKCSAWCRASLQQVWIFQSLAFVLRGRMASGQRFTAELNTILLHCALFYSFVTGWLENNEGDIMDAQRAWAEDIRDIEYGDDSLITVRKNVHLWYTPKFIVDHMAVNFGMAFTSAIKDQEVGFCTFDQAQFLKRHFIVVEDHWHAVLPIENILATLEWYNVSSGSKVDAVLSKVQSALDELGLYPEDVYNQYKRQIAIQCNKNGYPIVDIPYDVMRKRFLSS